MSQGTEQVEESSTLVDASLDHLQRWYHVPVLAILLGFMLWVRFRSYDRFTRNGEVYFSGNDAWYHLRQVEYTVQNWPATMPFDPWTYYPYGTSVGQFGTLYDQLVATAALAVGLGDPSQQTIATTLLVAPAVFGTLVAVPTYLVGKRLSGRLGGLFGVLVLALLPGTFLQRGLVGFADHNVAEPFFQAFAVLAMMIAVSAAERERPVYELIADRDFRAVRIPVGYAALAGVATALYLWTWPPGVLLVGIFGVFFMLKLSADYVRGVSPDHLAFVATTSMGVAGLLLFVPLGTVSFSATRFSLLQPLSAFAIAVGAVFMAWLAREWDDRGFSPSFYPVAIFGLLALFVGVVYVALPNVYELIRVNLVRFIGFNAGAAQRTIGEAQPFIRSGQTLAEAVIPQYGLTFFTAIVGALLMVWRAFAADEHDGEKMLVLVWAAFITAAAFTQVRFNYYLVVPVAVLNAYLIGWVLDVFGFESPTKETVRNVEDTVRNVEATQIFTILLVIVVVLPALVVPVSVGGSGKTTTAVQMGNSTGPGAITQWDGTLDWMSKNTPKEGQYDNPNGEPMEYYGTYRSGDGDYDYPKGSYGVMSWWDYGHWITAEGERIPNANPFQEGANTAANYLLANNESEANRILERQGDANETTRYVMVDWKMVETNGRDAKFFAPTVFNDSVSYTDFFNYIVVGQNQYVIRHEQPYYESMMVRLYKYHGSAVQPSPVVMDWERRNVNGQYVPGAPENSTIVKRFQTMKAARQYVENDSTSQIGGIGPFPNEPIPALEHYRVVKQGGQPSIYSKFNLYRQRAGLLSQAGINSQALYRTTPSWVKAFERVDGAKVQGTGPANTTITATVEMQSPGGGTFNYTQRAKTGQNGKFTMTLPYSTTGYEKWGTDKGYTNVSVRATGPYEFSTPRTFGENGVTFKNATAQVTEGQVIGENDSPVTVSVNNQQTVEMGSNNSTNGTAPNGTNGAPGNGSTGNGSAGNGSAGDGTNGSNNSSNDSASDLNAPEPASPTTRAGLVGAYAVTLLVARRD